MLGLESTHYLVDSLDFKGGITFFSENASTFGKVSGIKCKIIRERSSRRSLKAQNTRRGRGTFDG